MSRKATSDLTDIDEDEIALEGLLGGEESEESEDTEEMEDEEVSMDESDDEDEEPEEEDGKSLSRAKRDRVRERVKAVIDVELAYMRSMGELTDEDIRVIAKTVPLLIEAASGSQPDVKLDQITKWLTGPTVDSRLAQKAFKSGPVRALEDDLCVKAIGKNRIGGYLTIWGDQNRKDLTREYFTPQTAELDVVFKALGHIPALYNHAMDGVVKTTVVGLIDKMQPDEIGLWVEAQVKEHQLYQEMISPLIGQKMLGWSSGTLPGGREVLKSTGEIKRWPIVEGSLTPKPAEWRMVASWPVQALKALYKSTFGEDGVRELLRQIELESERIRILELEDL